MTKVIAMEVGKPAEIVDFDFRDSERARRFFGGNFEGHAFGEPDLMIYCNGYGKSECPPNRWCGRLEDVIHGNFLITRAKNGEEVDVTAEDFECCVPLFKMTTAGWR